MEEAIANSLVDQKRLEAERDKQRTEIANHFKSKSAENSGIDPFEQLQMNDKYNKAQYIFIIIYINSFMLT